jgi:hypothetical protein
MFEDPIPHLSSLKIIHSKHSVRHTADSTGTGAQTEVVTLNTLHWQNVKLVNLFRETPAK